MAAGRKAGFWRARPIAPKPRGASEPEPEPRREPVLARVVGELETPASEALDAVAAAAFAGPAGRARLAPLLARFEQEVGVLAPDDPELELLALVRMDWALCDVPAEPGAHPGDTWAWRVIHGRVPGVRCDPSPLRAAAARSVTGLFEVFPGEPTWVRDRISGLVLRLFDGVGPFPQVEPGRPAALWELRLVPDPSGGCFVARPAIDYPLELLELLEAEFPRRFACAVAEHPGEPGPRWPTMQDLRRARLRYLRAGGRTPIDRMLRWR
ncbi:MAG: hypothetical protein R6X02_17355 [Enhygromyxa sp.]